MRTLFISNVVPWPVNNGIRIRVHNLLRTVSEISEVTLVCFVNPGEERGAEELGRGVDEVFLLSRESCRYRRDEQLPYPMRVAQAVWEYCHPTKPAALAGWESAEAVDLMRKLATRDFDVVWAESFGLSPLLAHFPGALRVLDLADIEHRKLWHRLRGGVSGRRFPLECLEFLKLRRGERRLAGEVSYVTVCSETDRRALGGQDNVWVVPNGIDLPPLDRPRGEPAGDPTLLFIGDMGYAPNVDAVDFFVKDVLPLVHREMPAARFLIVGREPAPPVRRLHDGRRVVVTGTVSSVAPYLEAASLVVIPLRFGGGTRVKILEAMAHCRAVVSTTVGAEGLEVEPGRHLLVADDPRSFADACVSLLRHGEGRARLVLEAYELVRTKYDWKIIERKVKELVLNGGKNTGAGPEGGRSLTAGRR